MIPPDVSKSCRKQSSLARSQRSARALGSKPPLLPLPLRRQQHGTNILTMRRRTMASQGEGGEEGLPPKPPTPEEEKILEGEKVQV